MKSQVPIKARQNNYFDWIDEQIRRARNPEGSTPRERARRKWTTLEQTIFRLRSECICLKNELEAIRTSVKREEG